MGKHYVASHMKGLIMLIYISMLFILCLKREYTIESTLPWYSTRIGGFLFFFPLDISLLTMSSNSRIWRNKEQTTKHSWDLVSLSSQTGGHPLALLHICWWKPPSFTFTFSFWPPSWTHLEIHILEIM
jgi:hypothetical protein